MKRLALVVFVALGFAPLAALILALVNYDWVMALDWIHSDNVRISGCLFLGVQVLLYLHVLGKNMLISDTQRRRWRVMVFLLGPLVMPLYNIKYLIPFLVAQNTQSTPQ